MERLRYDRRPSGFTANALRMWALALLAAAVAGRSLIQNQIFGLGTISGPELMSVLERVPGAMNLAAIALVLQAAEACAVAVYAFLLTEGVRHTSDLKKYALRIAVLAVLTEIPYNISICGKWFDLGTRNPVFGLLICLAMLWFYQKYPGFKPMHIVYKVIATIGAFLWAVMLEVDCAACMVPIVAALWAFRNKPQLRSFAGAGAAVLCSMLSPFFMVTPMVFMLIHFYNGEEGEPNRVVNYLSYPALLIFFAVIGAALIK